jgi:hypothetical protein
MALPNGTTITLAQIQAEFGGANPISLTEYYKGGAYVRSFDYAPNVMVAGSISLSNFWNAYRAATLTVALSGSVSDGYFARGSGTGACTPSITATPSGGVGPYSYAWGYASGDTSFTMSGGTSATCTFRRSIAIVGTWNAIFRCVVTDSLGQTVTSADVGLSFDVY